ncbi:hypothetical protein LXL04_002258 [Taraxacum kok-saghyz]
MLLTAKIYGQKRNRKPEIAPCPSSRCSLSPFFPTPSFGTSPLQTTCIGFKSAVDCNGFLLPVRFLLPQFLNPSYYVSCATPRLPSSSSLRVCDNGVLLHRFEIEAFLDSFLIPSTIDYSRDNQQECMMLLVFDLSLLLKLLFLIYGIWISLSGVHSFLFDSAINRRPFLFSRTSDQNSLQVPKIENELIEMLAAGASRWKLLTFVTFILNNHHNLSFIYSNIHPKKWKSQKLQSRGLRGCWFGIANMILVKRMRETLDCVLILKGSHQAVAVKVSAKHCTFYNCRFLGFQEKMKHNKPLEDESDAADPYMVVMNKENDGYRRLYGRGDTNRLRITMTKRFKRTMRRRRLN